MPMNIAPPSGNIPKDILDATPATKGETPRRPSRAERRGSRRAVHTFKSAPRTIYAESALAGL